MVESAAQSLVTEPALEPSTTGCQEAQSAVTESRLCDFQPESSSPGHAVTNDSQKCESPKKAFLNTQAHKSNSSHENNLTENDVFQASSSLAESASDLDSDCVRNKVDSTRKCETSRKENPARQSKTEKKTDGRSSKSRPLPFAPVRLENIRLKSILPRSSSLKDAAKRGKFDWISVFQLC